jgi:hypothetical protein
MSTTIASLSPEVVLKCENRTTDVSRTYQWLWESLKEITSSGELRGEFDQLEQLGVPYNLTAGSREYSFSTLLLPSDYNDGTLNIRLWIDFPTNQVYRRLDMISYQEADNYANNPGKPTAWYRFADIYGFDLIPDSPYQIQARYLVQPPQASPIQNTAIVTPRDWDDVLVLMAAQKGFIELNQYEKAQALWQILHGDPRDQTRPGLIFSRKKRYQREAWRKEKPLRPYVGRYTRR